MGYVSDTIKTFLAGGGGGASLTVVGQPMDTIKVRLQTMPKPAAGQAPLYKGMIDCGMQTVKKEGFFALWKGMVPPLLATTPMYALCFTGYNVGKMIFCDDDAFDEGNFKLGQIGLAGATSAVFTTPIMAPQERLKSVLQTQQPGPDGKLPYRGMNDVARGLWKEGGIMNLGRGAMITVVRDSSASFMYFSSYEVCKYYCRKNLSSDGTLGLGHFILAGGIAGVLNWVPAIPFDVCKTVYQTAKMGEYTGVFIGSRPVYKKLLAEGGIKRLYAGTAPIFARAFPANAACFTGYEICMQILDWSGVF